MPSPTRWLRETTPGESSDFLDVDLKKPSPKKNWPPPRREEWEFDGMAVMKVEGLDPICPNCIKSSKVELFAGSPCTVKVTVKLAPPPSGTTFPTSTETVTYAELKYSDDDGNSTIQELG